MLAIIMVSYGRVDLMQGTLDSLFLSEIDRQTVKLYVVDNGSQPEMRALLSTYQDSFGRGIDSVTLLNENFGKPYAWNLGARIASEQCKVKSVSAPEHFLFCDNDIAFKPGWFDVMMPTYREHAGTGLACLSGMLWPGEAENVLTGASTKIHRTNRAPGCCIMISADRYKQIGDFDTKRLICTVDTEYYRVAAKHGYFAASVYPASVIEHTGRKHRTWTLNGEPKPLM